MIRMSGSCMDHEDDMMMVDDDDGDDDDDDYEYPELRVTSV